MDNCTPSYEEEELPVNPIVCGTPCSGCDFNAVVISSCSAQGCNFSWTVSRTGCSNNPDKDFTGTTRVGIGKTKNVDFFCDDNETCKRYRLKFMCTASANARLPERFEP